MEQEINNLPINDEPDASEKVKLDVVTYNITSIFNSGCKMDFQKIPKKYLVGTRMSVAKFKVDNCTVIIKNHYTLICMGSESEDHALSVAKKSVEKLQSWGIDATVNNYRITNIFCSCVLPWKIQMEALTIKYTDLFTYKSNYWVMNRKEKCSFVGAYSSGYIRIVGNSLEKNLRTLEKVLPFFSEFRVKV